METFQKTPSDWNQPHLEETFSMLRNLRRVVTGALEEKRTEGMIRSSLEARVDIYVGSKDAHFFENIHIADFIITSEARLVFEEPTKDAYQLEDVPHVGAIVHHATGQKCSRCWKILEEVSTESELCGRCAKVVEDHEI